MEERHDYHAHAVAGVAVAVCTAMLFIMTIVLFLQGSIDITPREVALFAAIPGLCAAYATHNTLRLLKSRR